MPSLPDTLTLGQYCIGIVILLAYNFISDALSKFNDKKKQMEIAEQSAKITVEKLNIEWSHESEVSFEAQMSDAITAATLYSLNKSAEQKEKAIIALNIVRVKATGNLASSLDDLYFNIDGTENVSGKELRKGLTKVIDSYRNQRRKNAAAQH